MKKLLTLGLVALTGCSTYLPRETFDLEETRIILDSEEGVNDSYQVFTMGRYPQHRVGGFQAGKTIYVRRDGVDRNSEPLPDFYTLGHEIWHRIKGDYHE